jgi:hypothetical protein
MEINVSSSRDGVWKEGGREGNISGVPPYEKEKKEKDIVSRGKVEGGRERGSSSSSSSSNNNNNKSTPLPTAPLRTTITATTTAAT